MEKDFIYGEAIAATSTVLDPARLMLLGGGLLVPAAGARSRRPV